jgi:hypothetical protein
MFYGVMHHGDLFGVVRWIDNRPTLSDFGLVDGEIVEVTILLGEATWSDTR